MTTIKLYNTATRSKQDFTPINADDVRMYVCGPTVYDRAHLGNARANVVFDTLYRLLRHVYGPDHVTYVRNFTDVDDKINARAAETGRPISDITAETTQWYLDDMAAIGSLLPSIKGKDHERAMPRATAWIAPMVAMIEELIAKDHAYAAEGHVLFAVESYKEYGKLSGRSIDDMIAGARVEVAPYKRNPMDFVLWKPSTDDQPGWDSPWGRGRPGWHIECSAMAAELLGETFDIHGGGNDLTFPHHENEIAQSRCVGHGFANVWLHNEMLQVEGKKMSKSLGNFFTVRDLLDQGVPGEVIRFVMLSTHYRKPMDWTEKKQEEAEKTLDTLTKALEVSRKNTGNVDPIGSEPPQGVAISLANDLDTHGALVSLIAAGQLVIDVEKGIVIEAVEGAASVQFLDGLEVFGLFDLLLRRSAKKRSHNNRLDSLAVKATLEYNLGKQQGNFERVDSLRNRIIAAGVVWKAGKDGVDLEVGPNFDPSKLEGLL